MYIVQEQIRIESITLRELTGRLDKDTNGRPESADYLRICCSDNLLSFSRIGYTDIYPDTNNAVRWLYVVNDIGEVRRINDISSDSQAGQWLATSRKFNYFSDILSDLLELKSGSSDEIFETVSDDILNSSENFGTDTLWHTEGDWKKGPDPKAPFGGWNDAAEWLPFTYEIMPHIGEQPMVGISRKVFVIEIDDRITRPGRNTYGSLRDRSIFGPLFERGHELDEDEAEHILHEIQDSGYRLETGAGVFLCNYDESVEEQNNDKSSERRNDRRSERSKSSDDFDINEWIPSETAAPTKNHLSRRSKQPRGASAIRRDYRPKENETENAPKFIGVTTLTDKSYQVLSIDKHDNFWDVSLREATSGNVLSGRLVEGVFDGDANDMQKALSNAFSLDIRIELKIHEGRSRNLIVGCSSLQNDEDKVVKTSDKMVHSIANQGNRNISRQKRRNVEKGNSSDYICIQRFTLNILKKRTVVNDGYTFMADRVGGKLRTFYKIGLSHDIPENLDDVSWTLVVSQEGEVWEIEDLNTKAFVKLAGRYHRGLNNVYKNLLNVHPDQYDIDEAIYDGLGDDDIYSELSTRLEDEGKSLEYRCVTEFSDEIQLSNDFVDGLISDDLYVAHYNVHCANIDKAPDLEKEYSELVYDEPDEVFKVIEASSELFCDSKGLEWMGVVGLIAE